MTNRLTRTPVEPVPPMGRGMTPMLVAADAFMALLLSRPGGLSLRHAWVTPATVVLCAVVAPASVALAVTLLARGGSLASALLLLLSGGSGSVLVVAAAQRRSRPRGRADPPHKTGAV